MFGLSPYGEEMVKLAEAYSSPSRFVRSKTIPKTRKGRRPISVANIVKKAGALRAVGGGLAAGTVGTLGAQSAYRDWSLGRKYRKAMEDRRRELERQRQAAQQKR